MNLYVLPWGQMSFWGATVITNLLSAIPYIGTPLVEFIWGGFSVDNATLNRFFSLHYLLPFILAALVVVHLIALHEHGSNNPLGISSNVDRLYFHPYFIYKDLVGFFVFFLFFFGIVFYAPNLMGQEMAVVNGNIYYNYNTICWNNLLLFLYTQSVSGTFVYDYREKLSLQPTVLSIFCLIFSLSFPSFVKIINQDQSAGNQTEKHLDHLNLDENLEVGSSETICVNSYKKNMDQFGYWFAGLIDGDGTLYVSQTGQPEIEITLHEEDVKTLYKIKSIIGYGIISKRISSKAYRIRIRNKEGCKMVINLINGKLLTSRKHDQLITMCQIFDIKPITNVSFSINNAWFSGFFDAEGYISVRNKYTLTLSVSQKDKDILEQIQQSFNCGNINYDKSWDGYNFNTTKRSHNLILIEYFNRFPLLTIKHIDIITFKRLLLFLERGYHYQKSPYKSRIDHLITVFKNRKKR